MIWIKIELKKMNEWIKFILKARIIMKKIRSKRVNYKNIMMEN